MRKILPLLTLLLLTYSWKASSLVPPGDCIQMSLSGKAVRILIPNSLEKTRSSGVCILFMKHKGQMIGVVEDYYDCYWGLQYRDQVGKEITIRNSFFSHIQDEELKDTLLLLEPDALFLHTFYE